MSDSGSFKIDETADIHPSVIMEGNITIGAYTKVDAGSVLMGNIVIGHHSLIRCNVTIRGRHRIGNWTHIYDNVCIEGGRPAKVGGNLTEVADESIIGDECWINHGAVMHGTQIGNRAGVGLNAACDYSTVIGEDAVLTNGSATSVGQVIPARSMYGGVPAQLLKENISAQNRTEYFGVDTVEWVHYQGVELIEKEIRAKGRSTS